MTPQEYFEKRVEEVLKNQDKWVYREGSCIEYQFKKYIPLYFFISDNEFVFRLRDWDETIYEWSVDIEVNVPKQFLDAEKLLISKRKEYKDESESKALNKLIEAMKE